MTKVENINRAKLRKRLMLIGLSASALTVTGCSKHDPLKDLEDAMNKIHVESVVDTESPIDEYYESYDTWYYDKGRFEKAFTKKNKGYSIGDTVKVPVLLNGEEMDYLTEKISSEEGISLDVEHMDLVISENFYEEFKNEIEYRQVKATIYYEIQAGETLLDIANRFETTVDKIVKDNNIENPNMVPYGMNIQIETKQYILDGLENETLETNKTK